MRAPSPALLPANAGQALWGGPGPFALLSCFEGEPGGKQKGTKMKPEELVLSCTKHL